MSYFYRVKENADLNMFAEMGYNLFPESITMYKFIEQPIDGEAAMYLRNRYYDNPSWIEKIYKKNKKELYDTIGVKYRNGELYINDRMRETLTMWRIEIDTADDNILYFRSLDVHDQLAFCNIEILKKYCGEEIEELLKKDLIEEVDADDVFPKQEADVQ